MSEAPGQHFRSWLLAIILLTAVVSVSASSGKLGWAWTPVQAMATAMLTWHLLRCFPYARLRVLLGIMALWVVLVEGVDLIHSGWQAREFLDSGLMLAGIFMGGILHGQLDACPTSVSSRSALMSHTGSKGQRQTERACRRSKRRRHVSWHGGRRRSDLQQSSLPTGSFRGGVAPGEEIACRNDDNVPINHLAVNRSPESRLTEGSFQEAGGPLTLP